MTPAETADFAQHDLADRAREFSAFTPRRTPSGAYARALSRLVDAARVFAQRSDEEWAEEVAALQDALAQTSAPPTSPGAVCPPAAPGTAAVSSGGGVFPTEGER